jgi:hypothetical protein
VLKVHKSEWQELRWIGLSEASEATGLHRNTINNIEVGRYAGDPKTLEIIEQNLSCRHPVHRREWRQTGCSPSQAAKAEAARTSPYGLFKIEK